MTRQLWIMLLCGTLIVLIINGLRMTFGIFLRPISLDLDISRQVFGLVIASQTLLFGLSQPIAGIFADRFGAVRVIVVGALIYALGLWLMSLAANAFDLYISLGLLIGLGLAGATNVIILGAVGKVVPNERRGVVFGTVIAAGSLGMFLLETTPTMRCTSTTSSQRAKMTPRTTLSSYGQTEAQALLPSLECSWNSALFK